MKYNVEMNRKLLRVYSKHTFEGTIEEFKKLKELGGFGLE